MVLDNDGLGDDATLFATPKVFGRANETDKLTKSFRNVVNNNTARLAVVHGKSGMGKTALVEESLRRRVCDNHGYFCAGKFFQQSNQGGYSALMAAFSDLCDLVVQADDFYKRKEAIQNILGTEGHILADLISSIHHFFPPERESDFYDYSMDKTAMTRFKLACKSFVHAMSDKRHPIVLFIDDIQWADVGSQQVIATLLEDHELCHVLFVLAYRDEEVGSTVSLLQHAHDSNFIDVQLASLDNHVIEELLADQMGLTFPEELTSEIRELSKLVTMKTGGNPFYVHQYIAFILAEGLLLWSARTKSWEFDVVDMQEQTMIPESLVEILECRMDRLAPDVVKILRIAAMIGFNFEERVLAEVLLRVGQDGKTSFSQLDTGKLSIKGTLNLAVREGLIEESTNVGHYLFSHDKLLASFLNRNREHEEISTMNFAIAECWIDLKGQGDQYSFRAAQHANKASALFIGKYGRLALVQLHIEAAKYCTKRSSFFVAAEHLRTGAEGLDREGPRWESNNELCLELHLKLAEVELILGDFAACDRHTNEILRHCTSEGDKIKAMWYQVMVKVAANEIVGSIIAGRDALRSLGGHFPVRVTMLHIARKLLRVRKLFRLMSIDNILNLPRLTNARKIATHRFLVHIAAMSLMEDKENFAIFAGLTATESSLTEGLSEFSATGLAIYALAEASMGNYEHAYKYGQTALTLTRKLKCLETEISTRTLLSLGVLHWKEPINNLVGPLSLAFSGSFMTGNLWYGALASANTLLCSLSSGINLAVLRDQARQFLGKFKEYKQDQLTICLQPTAQCIFHLTSMFDDDKWSDTVTITGSIMDEKKYLEECDRSNYATLKGDLYTLKLLLAYSFGQLDAAKIVLKQLKSAAKVMRLHYLFYTYHFFAGMTRLSLYQRERKHYHLRKARSHKKKLQNLRGINCPNSEPLVKILQFEELSLGASSAAGCIRYETALREAIHACGHSGLVQYMAIAYERAGFVFAALNMFSKADIYFDHALEVYEHEWGSIAKYAWLRQQRTNLLPCRPTQQKSLRGFRIEIPTTISEQIA